METQTPAMPKEGLRRGFAEGEKMPWKGIWFEVEKVEFDRLTLKPIGMTFSRYKEVHANG